MLETGQGVLTILASHHAPLFHLLGKQSGRDVDKITELESKNVPIREFCGQLIIGDCIGAMKLKISQQSQLPLSAGDHDVVLCSVEEFETFDGDVEPLYTAFLRKEGYM